MMDEREFELVNIIGGDLGANQRDLSRQMNLSLGLTNMLIGRLITKGYIRIKQLDKKKVEYLLTAKGFSEKMRKSVRYTMKTVNSLGLIRQSITRLLQELYIEGVRTFFVVGTSDLAVLVEMAMREDHLKGCSFIKVESPEEVKADGVLLVCLEKTDIVIPEGIRAINLVEELAKDEIFLATSMPAVAV